MISFEDENNQDARSKTQISYCYKYRRDNIKLHFGTLVWDGTQRDPQWDRGRVPGRYAHHRKRKRGVRLFYKGVGGAELPNRITTVKKKKSGERNITQDEESQKHR